MANCMQMSGVFVLNNSAVMNASLRFARKQALQFDHPAGHIYMPVALRESNYLAYIYAFCILFYHLIINQNTNKLVIFI